MLMEARGKDHEKPLRELTPRVDQQIGVSATVGEAVLPLFIKFLKCSEAFKEKFFKKRDRRIHASPVLASFIEYLIEQDGTDTIHCV